MLSSVMLLRVAFVRTYDSEECSASIIRMKRIGELGTLAVTGNRRTLLCSQETFLFLSPVLISVRG
jgi:hypothetical protein